MNERLPRVAQRTILILCTVLLIGGFQLATIRPGIPGDDDASLYLLHARNIAFGHPYSDTGFIHTPEAARYSPAAYPPIFPLILAPLFRYSGLEIRPYKILMIAILLLCLFVLAICFRGTTNHLQLLLILILFGLNPYITSLKNEVMPDFAFVLFLYLAILLFADMDDQRSVRSWLPRSLLAGLCSYLAYGVRSIGIGLIFAVAAFTIIRFRRPNRFAIVSIGVFLALAGLQRVIVHPESDYLRLATVNGHAIFANLRFYVGTASFLWDSGFGTRWRLVVFAVISIVALAGLWTWSLRRLNILAIFCIAYAAFLLLFWPFQNSRYIVPLLPAYVYFFARGMQMLEGFIATRSRLWGTITATVIIAATLVGYGANYAAADFGPFTNEPNSATSKELFAFIRNSVPPQAIVISNRPRNMALYGGHPAAWLPQDADLGSVRNYLKRLGARYLVVAPDDNAGWKAVPPQLKATIIFSNSEYLLYALPAVFGEVEGTQRNEQDTLPPN